MSEPHRQQVTILRRMRIACWITKATDTHQEHELLIDFPGQKWLRECASMSRLYVHCPSCLTKPRNIVVTNYNE